MDLKYRSNKIFRRTFLMRKNLKSKNKSFGNRDFCNVQNKN